MDIMIKDELQQAQDILEKLLKIYGNVESANYLLSNLKEAIEWITKANDSAVKMEEKLKWYKDNAKENGMI